MRDPVLALLAKEPAHGYEVRHRLVEALGPPGQALNPGQVYVTLARLEKDGLVAVEQVSQQSQPDKTSARAGRTSGDAGISSRSTPTRAPHSWRPARTCSPGECCGRLG